MKLSIPNKIPISKEDLACVGLFFFLVKIPIRTVLAHFLHTPALFNTWVSIALMYIPLMIIPFVRGKKRKVFDFCLVWIFMFLSCMITYAFHPDYEYWLFVGEFNIWRCIFYPDQAMYLYLFIRLIDDPEKIFNTLKRAALLLLAYNLYKFVYSVYIQGYWKSTGVYRGEEGQYNLGFGYDVLFLFVVFMVLGKRNSKWYYCLAGISLFFIVVAGSRGPLLGVGLILLLQLLDIIRNRSLFERIVLIGLFIVVMTVLLVNLTTIMMEVAFFLQRIGISSRTIMKVISGEFAKDIGRTRLYQIAIDLIRTGGPFGNGIYGDRVAISSLTTMWIGYCHQIVLEILVDFGYVLGSFFLVIMARRIIKILFAKESEWRSLYIIFLISASQLILSGSYLYSSIFWGCFAVGVCWSERNDITLSKMIRNKPSIFDSSFTSFSHWRTH